MLAIKLSDILFIMLINVKMPAIVGILTFMSTINSMLSFITSAPVFVMLAAKVASSVDHNHTALSQVLFNRMIILHVSFFTDGIFYPV